MKKLSSIVLALILTLSLCACNDEGKKSSGKGAIPYDFAGTWVGYSFFDGKYSKPADDPNVFRAELTFSTASADAKTGLYEGTFTLTLSKENYTASLSGKYETEALEADSFQCYSCNCYEAEGDEFWVDLIKAHRSDGVFSFWISSEDDYLHSMEGGFLNLYVFSKDFS